MTGSDIAIWAPPLRQMKLNRRAGKGDEYVGACPDCGGKDRFHIWPTDGDTGRFWCRACGRKGDAIDYLRWQHNMTFQEACEATGKRPIRRRTMKVDHSSWKIKKPTPVYIPKAPINQEPAEQLVNWFPPEHIETLGCAKCCFRHASYCTAHPRNQFVNIRCIDECPKPRTGGNEFQTEGNLYGDRNFSAKNCG